MRRKAQRIQADGSHPLSSRASELWESLQSPSGQECYWKIGIVQEGDIPKSYLLLDFNKKAFYFVQNSQYWEISSRKRRHMLLKLLSTNRRWSLFFLVSGGQSSLNPRWLSKRLHGFVLVHMQRETTTSCHQNFDQNFNSTKPWTPKYILGLLFVWTWLSACCFQEMLCLY